jgi:hypothetical protein
MAAPCGAAKFREETSKKQRAEASLRCTIYVARVALARSFLHCSMGGRAEFLSLKLLARLEPHSAAMPRLPAWLMMPMLLQAGSAHAGPADVETDPAQLCRAAIAATERVTRIPDAFLNAISRVETGRPEGGAVNPWPWTVNAAGAGHFYASKAEAVAAVRRFMASGIRSLDVGCLQVNLFYHPDAFGDLNQAFDPVANAAYAGKLLMALFQQTGSWPRAAAAYHSLTPALGEAYQKKVLEAWAVPDRPSATGHRGRDVARDLDEQPRRNQASADHDRAMASAAMAPPAFGFTRRLTLPQRGGILAKSLADYRVATIRVTVHAPDRHGSTGTIQARLSQD